jgi:glycosyltransferase involved in cell wall biosynthesis
MMNGEATKAARQIYYWVHHTGRYDGNTGVQRVVRSLGTALAAMSDVDVVPVRWCAEREAIVRAEAVWTNGLARYGGPLLAEPIEAGVPLHLTHADARHRQGAWLIIGEVTHFEIGGADAPSAALAVALDYARYHGLRIAVVFYDLIPLREPGYETLTTAHEAYAMALAAADVILPISRTAASDLMAWWREQGHDPDRLSPVRPVPLAAEMVGVPRVMAADPPARETTHLSAGARGPVRFLAIGTVEPRKNQLALMQAVNRLRGRRPELDIRLDVVGSLHHAVAAAVQQEAARSSGCIQLHQYTPEAVLRTLMLQCDATVFISLAEGFGLPIVESLWQGKPCLCSNVGSMAEIAAGGGCLAIDPRDPDAIEDGLERLAEDAELRLELARAAGTRDLRRWSDYAQAILAELDATSPVPLLAVIEGSIGGGEAVAAALEAACARVWRHHWRADSQAILPGFRQAGSSLPGIGRGELHGLWALLPLATTHGPAEAMLIQDEAQGLGVKLAIAIEAGRSVGEAELTLLAGVDLALFASSEDRDAALDRALRTLPRTATLRYRFRSARDGCETLAAIAVERPRISAVGVAQVPKRVFYVTGMTATHSFNTGIQRVTRALGRVLSEFGIDVVPVKWDEAGGCLAPLGASEEAHLARWDGPPAHASRGPLPETLAGEWLLVPEITVPSRPPDSNIAQFARSLGMRTAAIFYDLIPLKMASIYPPTTLPTFMQYWQLFSELDVALPISWTVAADLRRYLSEQGLRVPNIAVCPLAGDLPGAPRQLVPREGDPTAPLRLIAVGTWEPRKNYPTLLRAVMKARRLAAERPIHFTIVGRCAEFADLNAEINALAMQAGDVDLPEHVSDTELVALINRSDATVFGSWEEGFGLPVLESLWSGLPCLCHDGSAMAEVAPGGGVLSIDMRDEAAIARCIARLASEFGLIDRLRREAVARPIRTWEGYGRDVLSAIARAGTAPGWPLPAILTGAARPLLSCAITTYNRAHWLTHSLPRLIEAARPFRDQVEVVVCDNTSTDATPDIVARFAGTPSFSSRRNPANLGMLGNLGATTRASKGAYIWLMGDDDLIIDGAIEAVLSGLEAHPDVEMAYMNYAYTNFDAPEQLADPDDIVRTAKLIGPGGPNRRVAALREVAALNENLFTAIYACAFRRDHALRAYQQNVAGPPFSSLLTCIPSSVYALAALQDRPAWWVGRPAIVVNMNVSWLHWVLLWHLERMPDLFDAAELAGIDPVRVDRHRSKHCRNAGEWARMALMQADDAIREGFSVARLIERCKHLEAFVSEIPKLRAVYTEAWAAGRVAADGLDPGTLFARYGA